MAIDLFQLKRTIDALQTKIDKATGGLEQMNRRLKEDFACNDITVARAEVARLTDKVDRLTAEYDKAEKKFNEKWGHVLEDRDAR